MLFASPSAAALVGSTGYIDVFKRPSSCSSSRAKVEIQKLGGKPRVWQRKG